MYTLAPHRFTWPTDRVLWRRAVLIGVFGTAVPMVSIVSALLYLSSGISAILLTSGPAITVLMAHFALADETLTRRKILGIGLSMSGALMLAARGETGLPNVTEGSFIGYALIFFAMFSGGASMIYARKFMQQYDAIQVSSIRMFVSAIIIMPLSILFVGFNLQNVDSWGYFALFYAALAGTFGGFLLSFYNVKRFGATTAVMVQFFIPIFAGIGGVLLLDETITIEMSIGTALILSGITIISQKQE
jgi:drug/metabolite transporter (DMT)-like permease